MAEEKGSISLCAVTLHIAPEYGGGRKVQVEYGCNKGPYMVRACRYFKPMVAAGGLKCMGECHYFNNGCTSKKARESAKKRVQELLSTHTIK